MLRGLFAKAAGRRLREPGEGQRLKDLARELLGEGVELTSSEIDCGDPACPGGIETILLVLRPGERTRAVKIPGPMADVTEAALRAALAGRSEA